MRHMQRQSIHNRAFTLVELIVVIAIIGILASTLLLKYGGKTDQAKVAAAKMEVSELEGAVIEFQANCNRLPRSLDELINKPGDCPGWQEGGYLKGTKVRKDPWGHEFILHVGSGSDFEIVCLGADGKEGGSGVNQDISSRDLDGSGK